MKKPYPTTLAIDTSCDETSVAVVCGLDVLSNVLPSQSKIHSKYGGVVPGIAKLLHEKRIDSVVEEALKRAFTNIQYPTSNSQNTLEQYMENIDQIAVTVGPGLAIALEVGVRKAKELAIKFNKPLIVINHMEGHLLSAFAESKSQVPISKFQNLKLKTQNSKLDGQNVLRKTYNDKQIESFLDKASYPVLGLLVSGKHTEIVLVKGIGEYEIIGETLDDACGEAFDKAGRALGLGYPSGATIGKFAKENRKNLIIEQINSNKSVKIKGTNKSTGAIYELPVSMAKSGDLNFSYSGLKTAVRQLIDSLTINNIKDDKNEFGRELNALELDNQLSSKLTKEQIMDLAVVFEEAAFRPIELKLTEALRKYNAKSIWLGGGVVANGYLRSKVRKIAKNCGIEAYYPESKKLTTDNAAMIGVAANLEYLKFGSKIFVLTDRINEIDRDPTLELGEVRII